MTRSNDQRAGLAAIAIAAHAKAGDDNRNVVDNFTDLLTNLRHYARGNDVVFSAAIKTSRMHYEEEARVTVHANAQARIDNLAAIRRALDALEEWNCNATDAQDSEILDDANEAYANLGAVKLDRDDTPSAPPENNTGAALAIAISGISALCTTMEHSARSVMSADVLRSDAAIVAQQGRALLNRLGKMVAPAAEIAADA